MQAQRLRCEYLVEPLGIGVERPRLSWELRGGGRGARQTAYQVRAASTRSLLDSGGADLWDSGRVEGDACAQVEYAGTALGSMRHVAWTVRVWDENGEASAWAEPASFETGILDPSLWRAEWIAAGRRPRTRDGLPACPQMRREITLREAPVRARAYVGALGVYELHCNGRRAGDERFLPGWTDYRTRIPYAVHDVTDLLRAGANALGLVVGDGWYSGYVGFDGRRNRWGRTPQVCGLLRIDYADGESESFASDASWRVAFGAIRASDMLRGERFDATRALHGWSQPGYDDSAWAPVVLRRRPRAPLDARRCEPVRVTQELSPVAVTAREGGRHVVDLGQNMVGWVRLVSSAPRGTRITLRYAEMLDAGGDLYTENYRSASCVDTYVAGGDATEVWEPAFSFRGFRYVEVTAPAGTVDLSALRGCVAHTDVPFAGSFACSDPMLEQLHSNIVWGQRGNFLEVPTDCPQRDERLGWLGDAQVFAPTAMFTMDVAAFFGKWLRDVADAQRADGSFTDIAPEVPGMATGASSPAWADAGVIVPWLMHLRYGDRRLLGEMYPAMRRWIEHVHAENPSLLWEKARGGDYGDWLSIDADTPKEVLATAYFAESTRLLSLAAQALGESADAERYAELAAVVRDAFCRAYVDADGRVMGETQTGYVLALRFGLLPPQVRETATRHLVDDIVARGDHLSTGFLGVGHLLPALSENGHLDLAYRLLLQDTCPSWGFSIRHGATTIWERWDGWTPEKGFQTPAMNSFNHYALGSAGAWMHEVIGGIALDPSVPGGGHVVVHPRPGGGLAWARAEHRTLRGTVAVSWRLDGDRLALDVEIPPSSTATVRIPAAAAAGVSEGGGALRGAEGVGEVREENGEVVVEVASGRYSFTASRQPAEALA